MNLKMVTFIIDNTQFLVDADTAKEAIEFAIEANREIGEMDDDPECIDKVDNYEVEDIDFESLRWIFRFRGDDYMFSTANAICFND